MNLTFKLLLFFSAFSAIHCLNETTIGELKATLQPLKHQVDVALAGYKKHNYKVFQHAVDTFQYSRLVKHLPDNATFDKETAQAFHDLTMYQFIYPILADPIRLSEALKVNALGVMLRSIAGKDPKFWLKETIVNFSFQEVANLFDTILEINEEEKTAEFNKPNLHLDDLYYDLHTIRPDVFSLTSGFDNFNLEGIRKFGTENNVTEFVMNGIFDVLVALYKLPAIFPLDSRQKLEDTTVVLKEVILKELLLAGRLRKESILCGGGRCIREEKRHPTTHLAIHNLVNE